MRIVYFYQYFCTPKGSWGTRVYEFCKRWVEQGHDVTVVTSVYYKSDMKAEGLASTQEFDGIKVKVLNVEINNKQPILKRIWSFVSYSLLSSYYAFRLPADVVVASSGPITAGLPGLVARYLRGRRLVFEVRDLWPDGAIEMGMLNNKLLQRVAYGLENACYRAARRIVALSPGMVEWIHDQKGYAHALSVPNASDNDLFGPRRDFSLPEWAQGKHIVLYTGNIGPINNSELLYNTAKALYEEGREDVHVVLIGDGQSREALSQRLQADGLPNFHLVGLMPKEDLVGWVQQALCSVVPLQNRPMLNTSSPNKLFEALAAGTPVVQTTQGWIKRLLDDKKCGYTLGTENPQADLMKAIKELADSPGLREEMGRNGQALAQTDFDRDYLAQQMLDAIEAVGRGERVTKRVVKKATTGT